MNFELSKLKDVEDHTCGLVNMSKASAGQSYPAWFYEQSQHETQNGLEP